MRPHEATRSRTVIATAAALALVGCGADRAEPRAPAADPGHGASSAATPTAEPRAAAPYDLHEWGVLTIGPGGVELAAGPGHPPPQMVVEKPVLYVHADADTRFALSVRTGPGLEVAERWPGALTSPLRWEVEAGSASCPRSHTYPNACESLDGYCELHELVDYETSDASCLDVDGARLPLLFYRLRAREGAAPASLPVSWDGRTLHATRTVDAWYVAWDGRRVRTAALHLEAGEHPVPQLGTEDGAAAGRGLEAQLIARGLSDDERAAFRRAWWPPLLGNGVPWRTGGRAGGQEVVEEEAQRAGGIEDAPRENRTLLYWLEPDEIDAVARLEATPPPREARRAFLVRQTL